MSLRTRNDDLNVELLLQFVLQTSGGEGCAGQRSQLRAVVSKYYPWYTVPGAVSLQGGHDVLGGDPFQG